MTSGRSLDDTSTRARAREGNSADDPLLSLNAEQLVGRIRSLEAKLERFERVASLSNALMLRRSTPAPRVGRPADPDLRGKWVAWALASAPGGSIDLWIDANCIVMRPVGRVRDSAHSRIRTFVFASFDTHERQTGISVSLGRREQITTKLNNYAKAGRAILKRGEYSPISPSAGVVDLLG